MSHRNTRILSGCAALLLCAGLSGCRSVPASRPSASPDPAAHLLGLTAEQRMEDYEYLWSTLRDSYPCWGILESARALRWSASTPPTGRWWRKATATQTFTAPFTAPSTFWAPTDI
ncbi:MAG: hypothetical protein ACLUES_16490 [Flavonifractor plautii]